MPTRRRAAGPRAGAAPQRLHVLHLISRPRGAGRWGASLRGDVTPGASGPASGSPRVSLRPPPPPPRRPVFRVHLGRNLCCGSRPGPRKGLKGMPQVPAVWPQEDPDRDVPPEVRGPPSRAPAGCPPPQVWGRRRGGRARAPRSLPGRRRCLTLPQAVQPLPPRKPCLRALPGALVGSEFITPAPGGPVPLKSGSEADLPEP